MSRLLRSRSGMVAVALLLVGAVAAGLVVAGEQRWGLALAVLVLAVAAAWTLLAVTRLEWLQRTQHRSLQTTLATGPGTSGAAPSGAVPSGAAPIPVGSGRTATPASAGAARRGPAVGRDAARSPVDRSREDLLADLGLGDGERPEPVVLGVVSDALADALAAHVRVVRLEPWLLRRRFEDVRPTLVVVEERALRSGAWSGVEGTTTLSLTAELEGLLEAARAAAVPVVGLAAPGGGVHTPTMRASWTLALPAPAEEITPHGIPADPVLGALQDHALATRDVPA